MYRLVVAIIIFSRCISPVSSQKGLTGGILFSTDLNFYKYSNEQFRDDQRTDRISMGYTAGLTLGYNFSSRLEIVSAITVAKKVYKPDRLFHFGILREVDMQTREIPIYLKYSLFEINLKEYFYILVGMTYQAETNKNAYYDFRPGYDESYNFIHENNYLLYNFGVGYEFRLSPFLVLQSQVNMRFFKCHCEYLNSVIDKVGLEIMLKYAG